MAGLGQVAGGAFSAIAGGIENSNLYKENNDGMSKRDVRKEQKQIGKDYMSGESNDLSQMQDREKAMKLYEKKNKEDGVTSGAGIQLSDEDEKLLNTDFSTPAPGLQLLPEDDTDFRAQIENPFNSVQDAMNQGIDKLYDDDELFMLDPSNTSINAAGLRVTN